MLIGDTKMPTASQLPPSLKEFAFRNAIRVDSGQDFDHHTERLLRAMDRSLQREPKSSVLPGRVPAAPAESVRHEEATPSHFDQDKFGEITLADPAYQLYYAALKETIANTYVKIVVPGAP